MSQAMESPRGVETLAEMGVGRGGLIEQKIYQDPFGLEYWKSEPEGIAAVYLVDAKTAAAITGEAVQTPADASQYSGTWYKLFDNDKSTVPGSKKFKDLKAVAASIHDVFPADE